MEIITEKRTLKEKVKDKVHDVKEDAKIKLCNAADWVYNNKEIALVAAPLVAKSAQVVIKGITKGVTAGRQSRAVKNRDLRCYDPTQGHYWELRRKLSQNEWLYVNDQRKKGRNLGDILSKMDVLK